MQMTRNTSQLLTRGPLYPRSRSQNVTNNSGSAATLVTRARVRMRDGKHLSAVSCDRSEMSSVKLTDVSIDHRENSWGFQIWEVVTTVIL